MQESKKSLGRSLANSSRSRSSQKFVRHASCIHRRHTDSRQPDSQTGRQTDTQTYRDLINWGWNYPLSWLWQDLGLTNIFDCCLVNSCGGWLGESLWHSGSPGKEHHARLVQGSVKLAGLSSKSTCNSLLHLEFMVPCLA